MDLSKVPDLDLRQKIKPISDRMDAIDKQLRRMRAEFQDKFKIATVELDAEHDRLDAQLGELLVDRGEIVGTCDATGLPIFDDDETVEKCVLACIA